MRGHAIGRLWAREVAGQSTRLSLCGDVPLVSSRQGLFVPLLRWLPANNGGIPMIGREPSPKALESSAAGSGGQEKDGRVREDYTTAGHEPMRVPRPNGPWQEVRAATGKKRDTSFDVPDMASASAGKAGIAGQGLARREEEDTGRGRGTSTSGVSNGSEPRRCDFRTVPHGEPADHSSPSSRSFEGLSTDSDSARRDDEGDDHAEVYEDDEGYEDDEVFEDEDDGEDDDEHNEGTSDDLAERVPCALVHDVADSKSHETRGSRTTISRRVAEGSSTSGAMKSDEIDEGITETSLYDRPQTKDGRPEPEATLGDGGQEPRSMGGASEPKLSSHGATKGTGEARGNSTTQDVERGRAGNTIADETVGGGPSLTDSAKERPRLEDAAMGGDESEGACIRSLLYDDDFEDDGPRSSGSEGDPEGSIDAADSSSKERIAPVDATLESREISATCLQSAWRRKVAFREAGFILQQRIRERDALARMQEALRSPDADPSSRCYGANEAEGQVPSEPVASHQVVHRDAAARIQSHDRAMRVADEAREVGRGDDAEAHPPDDASRAGITEVGDDTGYGRPERDTLSAEASQRVPTVVSGQGMAVHSDGAAASRDRAEESRASPGVALPRRESDGSDDGEPNQSPAPGDQNHDSNTGHGEHRLLPSSPGARAPRRPERGAASSSPLSDDPVESSASDTSDGELDVSLSSDGDSTADSDKTVRAAGHDEQDGRGGSKNHAGRAEGPIPPRILLPLHRPPARRADDALSHAEESVERSPRFGEGLGDRLRGRGGSFRDEMPRGGEVGALSPVPEGPTPSASEYSEADVGYDSLSSSTASSSNGATGVDAFYGTAGSVPDPV